MKKINFDLERIEQSKRKSLEVVVILLMIKHFLKQPKFSIIKSEVYNRF